MDGKNDKLFVYIYNCLLQDPGTPAARRQWMSIDLGTEIYKDADQVAEWTVNDFDILVPAAANPK